MAATAVLVFGIASHAAAAGDDGRAHGRGQKSHSEHHQKLDDELEFRANYRAASSRTNVIVTLKAGGQLPVEFKGFRKALKRWSVDLNANSNTDEGRLNIINGYALSLPNGLIKRLAQHPDVFDIRYDRPLSKLNYRTALTTGGYAVNRALGLTGAGIGVAVIDSGVAQWHDDLTNTTSTLYPYANQRVSAFVDFVSGQIAPYDDQGHGTHVAGIIAGNGYDSNGLKAGVAPDASLAVLKVLDANGQGTISNIIAALDWVLANHTRHNIRVVNMSVGATVTESYWTDPLTLAAKRVVDAGVVVVSAAGNRGKNSLGQPQYGGIVAPGNAPWVLSVGASSHQGTADRADDVVALFSSRGPTYKDWSAKPDLVAPGTGTVSLSDPWGTYYTTKVPFLADGAASLALPFKPYLALSGTSMAAPVVAGTVALMLQANPSLTPNAVKAILQYTAQVYPGYDALTQGAGFLNTAGAVRLAKFYATAQPGDVAPTQAMWSKRLIWGNHLLTAGFPKPSANAFRVGTTWGVARTDDGQNIVWGTNCATADCSNIVWGTDGPGNIVWGTECATADCSNIVWGTAAGNQNVVWGTDCGGADCQNIVWGTACPPGDLMCNIVWGTVDAPANIVWGTNCDVAADPTCNIVWGTDDPGNVVWGTDGEGNVVWGTEGEANVVWGTDSTGNIVWGTPDVGNVVWSTTYTGTVQVLNWGTMFSTLSDEQILHLMNWIGGGVQLPAPQAPPAPAPIAPVDPAPPVAVAPPSPTPAPIAPAPAPVPPAPAPPAPAPPAPDPLPVAPPPAPVPAPAPVADPLAPAPTSPAPTAPVPGVL